MQRALFSLALVLLASAWTLDAKQPQDLAGLVVIIDPGHGGVDPGSHGTFPSGSSRVNVVEDEYCYDVAMRLRRQVVARGGIAVVTLRDTKQGQTTSERLQNQVIPSDGNEVFTRNRATVTAGNVGMSQRTRYANDILTRYGKSARVVFISIHFDVAGTRKDLAGVHFIAPPDPQPVPELIQALVEEFRKGNRLRKDSSQEEYHVVTKSGEVRDLFVLRPSLIKVRQRVLIELGNFNHAGDVWRIRSPGVRDAYVECIVSALSRVNKLPHSLFR